MLRAGVRAIDTPTACAYRLSPQACECVRGPRGRPTVVGVNRRIDHYNDPDAPLATELRPAVTVGVTNARGEVLLIRRDDNDLWALPGGMLDLGETVAQAAVREVAEDTGIECAVTGLVGVYSDPGHVIRYTGKTEVRQEFSVLLAARALAGTPTPSSESPEVAWVSPTEAHSRVTDPAMRRRLEHWLTEDDGPYLA